jgi:uncharacterized protein (UPF0335 family)
MNVKIILSHYHHAYAQTDGTMAWPNSREGDILRGSFEILKSLGSNDTKYDDVLKAADDYRFSQDATITHKARWNLENAITSYAQAWADEQLKNEKERSERLNTEAHDLSEKLIVCRREKKELNAQCEARNKDQNSLEEQRDHNAECVKIRDDKIKIMNDALQAARLLCANLDNGGVGHKTLVENFRKLDEEIK